ncbi:unnamed protein product [Mycena citricolor]|uniref:C2H2-type domain-containing protein n=1 Tax=Mycena citricolor TaxID=2018698 RepID=A0AAD2HH89_9AGAR|nr:unnamed protein product [Mycena citricolor]
MGISGLLPALKSISETKHLSEFAGQTLAVDGYVWLHRGIFTCATELATGVDTHKYVDYAMHRVRLLRHHKIEPYLVFDGGPLPAKKGTEVDRHKRRAEHLALGNALAKQGKTSQAREHYVKSIDVTPQMAFQVIKALRAESVQYVVAPYEADAQLAFLERMGLVDGVISEDSDLLVFGCRRVLFKMDVVSSTAVCIDRADFAGVTSSDGISLSGWSDTQFRTMAIMSGCDYLPSIPGIGLKTACSLLRKWKTIEHVLRVIQMEGKKSIPRKYLENFRLAEKCFLHQRVYDPKQQKLVHLVEPDGTWDEAANAYVGGDLDPRVAKQLAEGDLDPVTLLPMIDINPRYKPRVLNPIPFVINGDPRSVSAKGKQKMNGGLLNYLVPAKKDPMVVGKASGKRSLSGEMDRDIAVKRKKQEHSPKHSRFFGSARSRSVDAAPAAGPSRLVKENIAPDEDLEDEEEEDLDADLGWDSLSLVVQAPRDVTLADVDDPGDAVEQEDGYISPTPSRSRDVDDLSSPLRPSVRTPARKRLQIEVEDDEPEFDVVSSPPNEARLQPLRLPALYRISSPGKVLVAASPQTSDIDCYEEQTLDPESHEEASASTSTPSPSPLTPVDGAAIFDPDLDAQANAARHQIVAAGWKERWGHDKGRSTPMLRRRETTVTSVAETRHALRMYPGRHEQGKTRETNLNLQDHDHPHHPSPVTDQERYQDAVMDHSRHRHGYPESSQRSTRQQQRDDRLSLYPEPWPMDMGQRREDYFGRQSSAYRIDKEEYGTAHGTPFSHSAPAPTPFFLNAGSDGDRTQSFHHAELDQAPKLYHQNSSSSSMRGPEDPRDESSGPYPRSFIPILNRVSQIPSLPAPSASIEAESRARQSSLRSASPQDINLPAALPLVAPSGASTRRGPQRVHQCQVCHKEFPRPSALKTHMNGHNKLRPFPCGYPNCDRTFSVRSNARRHFKTHEKAAAPEAVEDAATPSSDTPSTSHAHPSSGLTLTALSSASAAQPHPHPHPYSYGPELHPAPPSPSSSSNRPPFRVRWVPPPDDSGDSALHSHAHHQMSDSESDIYHEMGYSPDRL